MGREKERGKASLSRGDSIYDVRKMLGLFTPLFLSEFYVLFVRKIGTFSDPPLPLSASIIYGSSLAGRPICECGKGKPRSDRENGEKPEISK